MKLLSLHIGGFFIGDLRMYSSEQFEDKKKLTTYAFDKYGVKLDGRLSMDDLIEGLNAASKSSENSQPEINEKPEQEPKAEIEVPVLKEPVKAVYKNDVVGKGLKLLRNRRNK